MVKVSKEDRHTLVELVREEIDAHQRGEVDRLTTNKELAKVLGISTPTVRKYLKETLTPQDEQSRIKILVSQGTKQRNELHGNPLNDLTTEQLSLAGKKGYQKGLSQRSPEERRDALTKSIESQSSEQRRQNGQKGAQTIFEKYGNHFPNWSDEQKRKTSRKVCIERNRDKNPASHLTYEQRRENGSKGGKIGGVRSAGSIKGKKYFIGSKFYTQSQQEGAVALMLEDYIPNYKIREGETFQVRDKGIGNGGIDFLVDDEFLEWHPIILHSSRRGDIPSDEEKNSYRKIIEELKGEKRKQFEETYKQVLGINYQNKRQESIDNSDYFGANVFLAKDVEELYDFISRHSDSLPDYETFAREFRETIKYVKGCKVKKKAA